MEADDLLLAGDDSSWNMSDWQWDSNAFVAVPKLEQQSGCCKRRKTSIPAAKRHSRPCGSCKATDGPLKFLQQAGDSAGSNSCGEGSDGQRNAVVATESPPAISSSAGRQNVVAAHVSGESACQADGCACDLTKQSVWHQKSRICDIHMSGVFLKQGKEQQFCQQCGRSHNPDAFDKGRRSCRTQLAKHAARRRKRSAAAASKDHSDAVAPSKVAGTSAATGCRAAVSIAALAMQDTSTDAWFQNLCSSQKAAENQSLAQPLDAGHRHSSGGSEQSQAKHKSLTQQIQPVAFEEFTSPPVYQPSMVPLDMSSSEALAGRGAAPGCQQLTSTPAWIGDATAHPTAQGSDDPLQDVLSWQLPPLEGCKPELSSFDQAMSFMQDGMGSGDAIVCAPYQQQPKLQPEPFMPAPGFDAPTPTFHPSSNPSGYADYAHFGSQVVPNGLGNMAIAPQQAWAANHTAVRLSIKLFNCTPAQLPGDLRERVTGWLGSTPAGVEAYIRPGCVHLTVQATVPKQAKGRAPGSPADSSVRKAVSHLLASPQQEVWHKCTMLVQLGNEAAVVHEGTPLKVWNIQARAEAEQPQPQQVRQGQACCKKQSSCCGGSASLPRKLPGLSHAQPMCLVAGQKAEQRVTVVGQGNPADCKVLCRAGGKHLEVQVLHAEVGHTLQVVVPGELPAGVLYLEVQRGSYMGPALPVLVAASAALAAEAVCMLQMTQPADRQGLIVDLGCAMLQAAVPQQQSRQQQSIVGGTSTLLPLIARAVQNGLPVMARQLLKLVILDDAKLLGGYREASGMGLLHLAVRSGNMEVLAAMLEEADAECWQGGLAGPSGITPFHRAVFSSEAQSVALRLSATLGACHWFSASTHDGHTPADFALRHGKAAALNHAVSVLMWSQASAGEFVSQLAKDTKQPCRSVTGDCCPAQQQSSSSASGWSDSSSSADDDSGSDVDASQTEGVSVSVLSESAFAVSHGLSAAADFVRDKKERLAAVLRQGSWFSSPLVR